jgi:hypothetical protein
VHGCDEVNTKGIRAITRETKNIWWSCRYGNLSTPQISPSADRMTRPTETHIMEINGGKTTLNKNSTDISDNTPRLVL